MVGAGPAGLTTACAAQESGAWTVTVLEKDPVYVGGISRTVRYQGWRFDIGGHRFFSKSEEINRWWKKRLPGEFIQVRRLSRILYRRKFYDYPLRPMNALGNLGVWTSGLCGLSYAWARLRPVRSEVSFEDWVVNRFGRRLFEIFFRTYTEKVWGIPTHQISADWAAQRIKGLSLSRALIDAFRPRGKNRGEVVKTLIDTFAYPRFGPGQMWEKAADDVRAAQGRVLLDRGVTRIDHRNGRVIAVECTAPAGAVERYEGDAFVLSMPLRESVMALDPPAPAAIREAARQLSYRDFLTVALIVDGENPFPDNWIYIHDPDVLLGRIQNYRNWSEAMVAEDNATCLGLEYFCFEGDGLWTMSDAELVELGKAELAQLNLIEPGRVREGVVVRMEKAYPVYDAEYRSRVDTIREFLGTLTNLQVVGRNGMHRYNNQDHSMMTGLLAAKNLTARDFDLWRVNTDAEYHEEVRRGQEATDPESGGRMVPRTIDRSVDRDR
ncbi:NAD(P)/FAD-dependent oxidoreductase [Synoicihabitans lomoniglobus]|uniref:NAD(P)/FAD-dependent oxidoreductase n=1 Tax=Synoicihabitans lomoniglobus TaxID=2909285 RepID=UPI0031F303B5